MLDKYIINQSIEEAKNRCGLRWDDNRQRLSFYEIMNNLLNSRILLLQDKLEEFKKIGYYAVNFYYGSPSVGCDDLYIKQNKREVLLLAYPVGCVGESKILYKGKLEMFLKEDFKTVPSVISNPPQENEYKKDGWYIWGTEDGIKAILKRNFLYAEISPET